MCADFKNTLNFSTRAYTSEEWAAIEEARNRGKIEFNFSARFTLDELSGWSPEQINALFDGIARCLSVREGVSGNE